ncbi:hypothetical protein F5887DRAFT_1074473 [Amanita rubescens]|nr:hypothetical protein F5887DRAFT_1074473 [Amanita rubescens]
MTFFEGAHDFSLHNNKMNDVKGNYNVNETKNVTNNTDCNNRYLFSDVSRGNNVTHTNSIGNGNGNIISNGNGPQTGGAASVNPQDIARVLFAAGVFNTVIPAAQGSVAPQSAPQQPTQSAAPTPAAPIPMNGIMESIQSGTWTPEMMSTFNAFLKYIQPVTQTDGKQPPNSQQ